MQDVDQAIAQASEDTIALWSATAEDSGLGARIRAKRQRYELVPEAMDFVSSSFQERVEAAQVARSSSANDQIVLYEPRAPPSYRVTESRKRQAYEPSPPPFNQQELIDEDYAHAPAHPDYRLPSDEL